MARLPIIEGSIQSGRRPVVIVQNDTGNKFSPTVIVVAVTTAIKVELPTHCSIYVKEPSIALCEQVFTLDKSMLEEYVCSLSSKELKNLNKALRVSLNLL